MRVDTYSFRITENIESDTCLIINTKNYGRPAYFPALVFFVRLPEA